MNKQHQHNETVIVGRVSPLGRNPKDRSQFGASEHESVGLRCANPTYRSERESVRAKLRLMVKRILRKYKYPPDQQESAVELILQQAQALGEMWV